MGERDHLCCFYKGLGCGKYFSGHVFGGDLKVPRCFFGAHLDVGRRGSIGSDFVTPAGVYHRCSIGGHLDVVARRCSIGGHYTVVADQYITITHRLLAV